MAYDDGKMQVIALNPRGQLDTANPPTDRPPGTLVEATDVHLQHLGPRGGAMALSWPHGATAYPTAAPRLITFDSSYDLTITGALDYKEQASLGTQWTFDMLLRVTSEAANHYDLFTWVCGTSPSLVRGILLTMQGTDDGAAARKLVVTTATAPTAGGTVTTYTLTSATALVVGAADENIYHVRVVRDGAGLYLYLNGVLDNSIATLTAENPSQNAGSDNTAYWSMCSGGNNFPGQIYYVTMRTGAYRTVPMSAVMPRHTLFRNCKLAIIPSLMSSSATLQANQYIPDYSRFEAHGMVVDGFASVATTASSSGLIGTPVQGIGHYTGVDGIASNSVMVGGRLYTRQSDGR